MKISYHTIKNNLDTTIGFGNAGFNVVRSLQRLGYIVPFDDPTAPVQISFNHPYLYNFHTNQYKIGYSPWESTELPPGWLDKMNSCDEIWATSDWTASVFRNAGVSVPVKTYLHGLDPSWQPIKRERTNVVRFLHMGEPALRKGGQMAVDAFRAAFGDRTDVHLTVKAYYQSNIRAWSPAGFGLPHYNNVSIITENLTGQGLRRLYAEHDIMVYPSYGEGFGLIPLQALGTGMPVICTHAWAPYKRYLRTLGLSSRLDRSIWSVHPGNVFYPDFEELVQLYIYAFDEVDYLSATFYEQAPEVHHAFNWDRLTAEVITDLTQKFA